MSRRSRTGDLAARLAFRMLASPWGRGQLLISCRRALGSEPPWLADVVDATVRRFPVKPAGRPEALTAVITAELASMLDAADSLPPITSLPIGDLDPPEQRMTTSRWPVPPLGTETELADLLRVDLPVLLWLADARHLNRRLPDRGLHTYRYRWLPRSGRTPRLLEAPGPLLRHVQRRLLASVIDHVPVHPAAYGFVRGRSAVQNAAQHVGRDWVINVDLSSFFAGVRAARIAGILATIGYPESVVRLMTGLTTTRTPQFVLQQMPPDERPEDRALLRARLRSAHLAQGAPTSPALANLVAFNLDRRLAGLAETLGIRYTRYADDLTFSGDGRRPSDRFIGLVRSVINAEGFRPNESKLRIRVRTTRQTVTGIVVNERTNLTRRDHDQLRAVLHDAVRHGPDAANREHVPDFRAHLEGRVGWAEHLNPVRGGRLRRQLDQISWPPG